MKKTFKTIFLFSLLVSFFFSCKKNEVKNIILDKSDGILTIGETLQLKVSIEATKDASEFLPIWFSNNAEVATVNENGLVKAISTGKALITAKVGAKEAYCEVTVRYFTQAKLDFLGNIYATGKSNAFGLYFATEKVDLQELTGNGEYLYIELYVDPAVVDSLPDGNYTMVGNFVPENEMEYYKLLPNTISPGFTKNGNNWGSWYNVLSENNSTAIALTAGEINVAKSGLIYTITYNLYDNTEKLHSGIYQGELEK